MSSNIPISTGSGAASVATEQIGNNQYQQIKVVGGEVGSTSVLGVNPDRSINVSVIGAISATLTGNTSISGAVTVAGSVLLGNSNGSVITVSQGSVAAVIVGGSIAASFTPPANQSVSGTTGASVIGWVPVQPSNTSTIGVIQGSVATVIIGGSIAASFTPPTNQSVSGTVGASVIGWVPIQPSNTSTIGVFQNSSIIAVPTGNQSVSGAVQIYGNSSLATVHIIDDQIISSMVALVTDTIIHGRTTGAGGGYVEVKVDPSGAIVTAMSSVVAFQGGVRTTSVISATPSSMLVGASIFGQLPAGTAPLGSVATLQGTNPWVMVGSVYGSGSVVQFQGGTQITSLVSTVPSSVIVGASIFGQLPAGTAVLGSVATLQATTPWIISSVYGNISGSVVAFQGAGWSGSVAAQATITSIATANGGLPIYAPLTSRLQGTADLRTVQGASVAVIGAQGAGVRVYVEHVQVANYGSASVLVTIADNTTSILGYTIAPAGGGSNYRAFYRGAANSPITASINGTASVLVSMQGFSSGT